VEPARLEAWLRAGGLALPPGARLGIHGRDPVLPARFAAGEMAAVALGLAGVRAARLHHARGGPEQGVEVDVREAAAGLLGFLLQRDEGGIDLARHQNPSIGLYATADGRWIHLHGGFPHLAAGLVRLLGCALDAEAIAKAVARRDAFALEEEIAAAGLCGAVVRTATEWAAHPQGRALAGRPTLEVERIGDAPPRPWPGGGRPLSGIRVLDLTRVLAGPACGRMLAAHGADVLRIGAARLPSIEPFVVDTGHGKRNAFLDLDRPGDRERLDALLDAADVLCQGYRPGALVRRGLGPEHAAARRPGIVYVSIDCYGHVGPWAGRPGWEQLAQAATGVAAGEGGSGPPRLVPAAATDYTTGHLAAAGVMEALARRAQEGGSWHVKASLCQTGMWLTRLGADCDPARAQGPGDLDALLHPTDTAWGRLWHLGPGVRMEATPPRWDRPPSPWGAMRRTGLRSGRRRAATCPGSGARGTRRDCRSGAGARRTAMRRLRAETADRAARTPSRPPSQEAPP